MSNTEAGRLAEEWGGEPRDWYTVIRATRAEIEAEEGCSTNEAAAALVVRHMIDLAIGPGDGVFADLFLPTQEEIAAVLLKHSAATVWVALRVRLHFGMVR